MGLGDLVASALSKVGITKERVEAWLGAPCNCLERQQKLNKLGEWAMGLTGKTPQPAEVEKAKESLNTILHTATPAARQVNKPAGRLTSGPKKAARKSEVVPNYVMLELREELDRKALFAEDLMRGEELPVTAVNVIRDAVNARTMNVVTDDPQAALWLNRTEIHAWRNIETRYVAQLRLRGLLDDRSQSTTARTASAVTWAYGVTTVPDRRNTLLPRTLASLKAAGFTSPWLFVDGAKDVESWEHQFKLNVEAHTARIGASANWVHALYELYHRNSNATYYAVFQDDLVMSKGVKAYLESLNYPTRGYWNLYTFPEYSRSFPAIGQTGRRQQGWFPSISQRGLGAVALVFSNEAVAILLTSRHLFDRHKDPKRGHQYIDGGIVDSFRKAGWKEYVHNPSLVQHTGTKSTMGHQPQPQADTFKGEEFDATTLLSSKE